MSGGVLFGPSGWDPVAIIGQIVALQCLYYLSLGLLYKLIVAPYVRTLTLYHFFDWRWASFSSFQGWMVCIAGFTNALLAAVFLRLIVQRAKKCLDFAGTILLIHFAAVWCFSGFPRHAAWWALQGSNLAATSLLGEYLCMQKEMQEIPLASLRRNGALAEAAAGPGGSRPGGGGGGGILGRSNAGNARSSAVNVMELTSIVTQPSAGDWGPLSPVK
ncbi:hypothetical protein ABPG75_006505 [Micractinium tetrahymenae]